MKKYIFPGMILVVSALLFLQNHLTSAMNTINPLTNDIPWTTIAIVGGVALVAVIVLVVMGAMNKKRGGK